MLFMYSLLLNNKTHEIWYLIYWNKFAVSKRFLRNLNV